MAGQRLGPEHLPAVQAAVAAWLAVPDIVPDCPACGRAGLAIADHSARPHAEWYHLTCAACGLDEMLVVPLGAAVPGGES